MTSRPASPGDETQSDGGRARCAADEGIAMDQLETMGKVLRETQRIVDHIEPSQLDDPTPCSEWTVRDLLNHVTGGAEMFADRGRRGKRARRQARRAACR